MNKKSLKPKLKVGKFKNEDQERDFWGGIDFSEYFEPKDFVPVIFPNLKPSSSSISIRIPDYLIARVKEQANMAGVPYQSLMKQYIARGVEKERMFATSKKPVRV